MEKEWALIGDTAMDYYKGLTILAKIFKQASREYFMMIGGRRAYTLNKFSIYSIDKFLSEIDTYLDGSIFDSKDKKLIRYADCLIHHQERFNGSVFLFNSLDLYNVTKDVSKIDRIVLTRNEIPVYQTTYVPTFDQMKIIGVDGAEIFSSSRVDTNLSSGFPRYPMIPFYDHVNLYGGKFQYIGYLRFLYEDGEQNLYNSETPTDFLLCDHDKLSDDDFDPFSYKNKTLLVLYGMQGIVHGGMITVSKKVVPAEFAKSPGKLMIHMYRDPSNDNSYAIRFTKQIGGLLWLASDFKTIIVK